MSTPESQFNKNMALLTQFLMQKDLIGTRIGGYRGLETQRHGNMMTRLQEAFSSQIARDPVMQRHRALVFKAQQEGKDPASLIEAMKKDALNIAKVSYETATGKPWTQETAQAATLLAEPAIVDMVGQAATTTRLKERISKVDIPGQVLRGREVAVKEKEQEGKTGEQYQKGMIDLVKDTVNFLESEGVKGEEMNEQLRSLFSSGKIADPLSPENRGKAFTYLMEIWTNLVKGKSLTTGEERFLINIRNTRAIETPPGGAGTEGLPSPALGGESEAQIRQNMVNQIAGYIMERSPSIDPAQANSLAEEFYDTQIRK